MHASVDADHIHCRSWKRRRGKHGGEGTRRRRPRTPTLMKNSRWVMGSPGRPASPGTPSQAPCCSRRKTHSYRCAPLASPSQPCVCTLPRLLMQEVCWRAFSRGYAVMEQDRRRHANAGCLQQLFWPYGSSGCVAHRQENSPLL
jgi:hypothetical protein